MTNPYCWTLRIVPVPNTSKWANNEPYLSARFLQIWTKLSTNLTSLLNIPFFLSECGTLARISHSVAIFKVSINLGRFKSQSKSYDHHAIKLEFSNKHVSVKPVQCLEIKKWSNRDQEKIEQILIWRNEKHSIWDVTKKGTGIFIALNAHVWHEERSKPFTLSI